MSIGYPNPARPGLFDVFGLQLDLAAAGGDGGGIVAVQVEELRGIVVPVADCEMLAIALWRKEKICGVILPSHPPKPLASDHWKLLPLTENPELPWPALITMGSQAVREALVQIQMRPVWGSGLLTGVIGVAGGNDSPWEVGLQVEEGVGAV